MSHIPLVRGRRFRLSLPRRLVNDLLYFSKRVPSVPMQRRMHLAEVVEARSAREQHISWCAIFLKAYSIVSAANPQLRRSFLRFPFGHIYEHPMNVASFSVERKYHGEDGVFFAQIAEPEKLSLLELDALVRHYKQATIESVPSYRRSLGISKLPLPVRRFLWWLGLETDGMHRAANFGTFGISVVAALGASGLHLLSPLTTTLNYGTLEPDGSLDVRLAYDHRVIDGAPMARAMAELEAALLGPVLAELKQLAEAEEGDSLRHIPLHAFAGQPQAYSLASA